MITVTVAEARKRFSELLRRVEAGEEVAITRYRQEVARLSPASSPRRFPDMAAFRSGLAVSKEAEPTSALVVRMREEAGH